MNDDIYNILMLCTILFFGAGFFTALLIATWVMIEALSD